MQTGSSFLAPAETAVRSGSLQRKGVRSLQTFSNESLFARHEVKPDRNNFAPRFGFAYSPHSMRRIFGDNLTVIRGGYGMFYDTFFTNISNNTAATSPNSATFSQDALTGRGIL